MFCQWHDVNNQKDSLSSAKDSVELIFNLNSNLNKISQWLTSNKLQHHSTKTKLMYVGSKHNLHKIRESTFIMPRGG